MGRALIFKINPKNKPMAIAPGVELASLGAQARQAAIEIFKICYDIHNAARVLEAIDNKKFAVNTYNEKGFTLLHVATVMNLRSRGMDLPLELMKRGADPNFLREEDKALANGAMPKSCDGWSGHYDLGKGRIINFASMPRTPYMLAVEYYRYETMQQMRAFGADGSVANILRVSADMLLSRNPNHDGRKGYSRSTNPGAASNGHTNGTVQQAIAVATAVKTR